MTSHPQLRFAVIATDIALFSYSKGVLSVRVTPCTNTKDFPSMKALPGGLIHVNETSDQAIKRILKEKADTKYEHVYMQQLKTYSRIDRDPRGRVVSVAYIGTINESHIRDEERECFIPINRLRTLAYDHDDIAKDAHMMLRELVMTTNIIFMLIPEEFTVAELQEAWESIMGERADKRNFLKKLKLAKGIKDTKKKRKEGAHRPSSIFSHPHKSIVKQGFF